MGDSLLVIELMKHMRNLENINLRHIFEEVKNYSNSISNVGKPTLKIWPSSASIVME